MVKRIYWLTLRQPLVNISSHLAGASEALLLKTLALRVTAAATMRGEVAAAVSKAVLLCLDGVLTGAGPA